MLVSYWMILEINMSGTYQKHQKSEKSNKTISLDQSYSLDWNNIDKKLKYFVMKI